MTKLKQAAQNLLDYFDIDDCGILFNSRMEALREALDHSGEADEMVVGWDRVKPEAIASDPLYQQGFVDGVEEGRNQVAEQAEQEPVYISEHCFRNGCACHYSTEVDGVPVTVYAAPVRTKDLSDDEIADALYGKGRWRLGVHPDHLREYRRVIAADRELNK